MMSQTTFNLFIIDNEAMLLDLEDYDDVLQWFTLICCTVMENERLLMEVLTST